MSENRLRDEFVNRDNRETVRLNKFLSEAGMCSRREADRLISSGKVMVDGKTAQMGQKVLPDQRIEIAEASTVKRAVREKEMVLLAVNKPRGVVCTTDERWGDITIEKFLNYPKRVFPVGRLDKDSEGLLLMTNNGDILNKIMRAGNYHEKEYLVSVDHPVTEDFLKKMGAGVYLRELGVTTRPCKVKKAGDRQFVIVLTQGLNRQIRRMCKELGFHVTKLKRVRIMNIRLGNLKTGQYRKVTDAEMKQLYEMIKESRS